MTALNKQALRVPERKRHDWSQAVMRDCDFCDQWSLTVKHENSGCICASCCDAEYTSELKCTLETAIDRAEAAEELVELQRFKLERQAEDLHQAKSLESIHRDKRFEVEREFRDYKDRAESNQMRLAKDVCRLEDELTAAGIGVKGD